MIFKSKLLPILSTVTLLSCGGSDEPALFSEEIIENPVSATLVFPENNTECNEGIIINDKQSKVIFRWSNAEFSNSYEVILENLETHIKSTVESATNSTKIIIDRGTAYKWYVISKSDRSPKTSKSEKWQFYNAGVGAVSHAPFPANAIAPENNSKATPSLGKVTLEWIALDIDKDIKEHEILFETENPPKASLGSTIKKEFEVDVTSGTEYFWRVKTTDETNNISTSDIFSFTVN